MKISDKQLDDLIESYSSQIRAICRKFYIAGGTEDDLFQEGMIGLLQATKTFSGDSVNSNQFKAFANLCIKRQIYDAIKSANKKANQALNNYLPINRQSHDAEYERVEMSEITDHNSLEDIVLGKAEFEQKIADLNSKLSPLEQKVLKLYIEGEKQSEIAKILGKSVKSIDNTIQRIKNKVK